MRIYLNKRPPNSILLYRKQKQPYISNKKVTTANMWSNESIDKFRMLAGDIKMQHKKACPNYNVCRSNQVDEGSAIDELQQHNTYPYFTTLELNSNCDNVINCKEESSNHNLSQYLSNSASEHFINEQQLENTDMDGEKIHSDQYLDYNMLLNSNYDKCDKNLYTSNS